MRLKALDDALKDAFFNGAYGWMKLEGSSGSVETLPPFKGVLAHYGDSEGYETVSPKDMELIKVEGDLSADELGYIIYLRKKYKDLEPEIKQEIVRIRKEQAVEFLEEREKVIKAQGEGEKSLDYYEDYLELKKNPDIQDFLKACDILPQGLWLSEEDEFITCDGFSEDDRTDIQNRFPVLLSYYEAILKEVLLEEEKDTAPDKARGQNRRIEKERRKKECYRLYDELEKNESKDTEPLRKAKIASKMGVSTKSVTRYLQERE